MATVVGIAEMHMSQDPGDTLVTYSLGSCLGVTVYDPILKVGGMIHCMLPLSKIDTTKATENPSMFIDTGVIALFNAIFALGAKKERLIVKVAGGASPLDAGARFKIGERNYTVLRKVLWKNNLLLAGKSIGGTKPRTLRLELETGRTSVQSNGETVEL